MLLLERFLIYLICTDLELQLLELDEKDKPKNTRPRPLSPTNCNSVFWEMLGTDLDMLPRYVVIIHDTF